MEKPVASLNLPNHKIVELQGFGYNYCNEVNIEEGNFKSKFSLPEWEKLQICSKTKSALDLYQEECTFGRILTLHKELDDILGGGLPTGLITEFCGEPGSGKTQLCFQLCMSVQLPKWCGGIAGQAIYIGTNKGFAAHRLREIAADYTKKYETLKAANLSDLGVADDELTVETIMKNIHFVSVSDHLELIAVIKYLPTWLEEHNLIRLVMVDSISDPLKLINGQERTKLLYSMLNDLQILSQQYKFGIVLTNNFTTRKHTQAISRVPSLGDSYYHRINIRIILSKVSTNCVKAAIVKSLFDIATVQFNLC